MLPDALQALEWAPLAENFFLAVYSLLVLNILVFETRVHFRALFIRVPYYIGDRKGDPHLENYLYNVKKIYIYIYIYISIPLHQGERGDESGVCMDLESRGWE